MSFSMRTAGQRPNRVDLGLAFIAALAAVLVAIATMPSARAREAVAMPAGLTAGIDLPAGTILVRQSERQLYLALGDGAAIRYPVGVGKPGKQWHGTARIDGKYVNPAWAPPREVKRAEPWLPDYIAGGAANNPMGHRALTLTGGQYAIHGTNRPWTVGTAASFGCIRMREADIEDLFERVAVGTPVVMVR